MSYFTVFYPIVGVVFSIVFWVFSGGLSFGQRMGVVAGIFGALFAINHRLSVRKNIDDSKNWPSAVAVIDSAMVTTRSSDVKKSKGIPSKTYYAPSLQYSFEVNGRSCKGSRIRFVEQKYGSRADAEQAMLAYPRGSSMTVYYDPKDCENSVLERGG